MTIERLELRQWEKIMSHEDEMSPFLSIKFLSCLSNYSKAKMELFGFYQGTQLIGYMPAFYSNFGPIKTLFSPPYNSAIPFLGYSLTKDYHSQKQNKKEGILKTIAKDLKLEIQNHHVQYTFIDLDSQKNDIRPFLWQGFKVKPNYDYDLSLERDETDIWNSFKVEARRDILSAERQGIFIKRETNIHHFWTQEESRYQEQKLKMPIYMESYIQTLVTEMPFSFHLYYSYDSSDNIVGSIIVFIKDKSVYLWLGATRLKNHTHANDLMFWELMKQYKAKGYQHIIIMGANQERLCEFKSKFNPIPIIRFTVINETILGKTMSLTYRKIIKRL